MVHKIAIPFILLIVTCCNGPQFKNEIRRVWSGSQELNTCFCQDYNLNKAIKINNLVRCEEYFEALNDKIRLDNIDREENGEEPLPLYPILDNEVYCYNLVGFSAEAVAKRITPKAREIIRYHEDQKK